MDINQWIDKQIAEGRWHPDYKNIYLTITREYQEYQKRTGDYDNDMNGKSEKTYNPWKNAVPVKEFPCFECGSGRANHKKTCSLYKGIRNKEEKQLTKKEGVISSIKT